VPHSEGVVETVAGDTDEECSRQLFKKILWRLMPLVTVAFLIAQIDKMNISFAKLVMFDALGFSDTVYGLGATIFLIAYSIFGVPSNVMLRFFGARKWIGFLMVTWGISSAVTLVVKTPTEFYLVRFLLGVTEAGFYPGVICYLSTWFTPQYRTKAVAIFMAAAAVSGIIAGPVSAFVLHYFDSLYGFAGWQWLFLVEAAPAVLLGIVIWIYLTPEPAAARWLSNEEKALLLKLLEKSAKAVEAVSIRTMLVRPKIWVLGAIFGGINTLFFAVFFWLPTMIKSAGIQDVLQIGELSAIPWAVATVAMLTVAASVDKRQNSHAWLTALLLTGAAVWLIVPLVMGNIVWSLVAMSVAVASILTAGPIFWNLPTAAYGGSSAGLAIAFVMMQSQCYTFLSPYLIALLKAGLGGINSVMYLLAAVSIISAALTELDRRASRASALELTRRRRYC
jgi:MFS family permease